MGYVKRKLQAQLHSSWMKHLEHADSFQMRFDCFFRLPDDILQTTVPWFDYRYDSFRV